MCAPRKEEPHQKGNGNWLHPRVQTGQNPTPLHIWKCLYKPTREFTSLLNSIWVRKWTSHVHEFPSALGKWWNILRKSLLREALRSWSLETELGQALTEKLPDLLSVASPHETALPGTKESDREQRVWGGGKEGKWWRYKAGRKERSSLNWEVSLNSNRRALGRARHILEVVLCVWSRPSDSIGSWHL